MAELLRITDVPEEFHEDDDSDLYRLLYVLDEEENKVVVYFWSNPDMLTDEESDDSSYLETAISQQDTEYVTGRHNFYPTEGQSTEASSDEEYSSDEDHSNLLSSPKSPS